MIGHDVGWYTKDADNACMWKISLLKLVLFLIIGYERGTRALQDPWVSTTFWSCLSHVSYSVSYPTMEDKRTVANERIENGGLLV